MNVVTVNEAKRDLDSLIAKVVSNAEPIIITMDTGQQIVLLPLDEFNAWQETAYLLSNPAHAAHLRQSIAEQQLGKIVSPVTGQVERDLTMARTTIDILGMMEKKMKGNLTAEEARFIAHSLHELRLNFVDETKKEAKLKEAPQSKSEEPPKSATSDRDGQ
jgi:antitoxin YefM